MSRLDALIKEYCPDGVEYDILKNLGSFYGGLSGKTKKDFSNGNSKFITYMNVFANPSLNINTEEKVFISENEKQNTVLYGDIIFTGSSENKNECGMSSVLTEKTDEKLYLNSFSFGFRFNDHNLLLPEFSKHLFRSQELRKQINKTASGVTRFNVSKKKMEKVLIPLPPAPVQAEIVRILDNFTELTAELTAELAAELTARKEQYEHYRDSLLEFDNTVEWKPLGETCTLKAGKSKLTNEISKFSDETYIYPCYGGNGVRGYTTNYSNEGCYSIIGRQGALCGNVVYTEGFFYATEHAVVVYPKESYNSKFLFYMLNAGNLNQYKTGGAQPGLSVARLNTVKFPLPSLDKQQRIADVLNRFDTLCNNISVGLPAEIKAREEQYEYYRNKLLTFKEKEV